LIYIKYLNTSTIKFPEPKNCQKYTNESYVNILLFKNEKHDRIQIFIFNQIHVFFRIKFFVVLKYINLSNIEDHDKILSVDLNLFDGRYATLWLLNIGLKACLQIAELWKCLSIVGLFNVEFSCAALLHAGERDNLGNHLPISNLRKEMCALEINSICTRIFFVSLCFPKV